MDFADNYSSSYGTDLVIVGGDMNSSPGTPVYNAFSQLVDCLVDKFGAASSSLSSHHTWGQSTNTYTGPGGSQSDDHAARSVSPHHPPLTNRIRLQKVSMMLIFTSSLLSGSTIFSTG